MKKLLVFLSFVIFGFASADKTERPTFDNYLVDLDQKTNLTNRVDLESHPGARMYRTRLREGAKSEVNFAGYFSVVNWGCGTECQAFLIIDRTNGKVFGIDGEKGYPMSSRGVDFRKNSRLMIINPDCKREYNPCVSHGASELPIRYYLMESTGLKLIHEIQCRIEDEIQVCE